ncbi:MAG: hypothetical protein NVS1B11_12550 [Terriglobales bacterium]
MKLTTGILIIGMTAGSAWAQSPNIITIQKNKLNAVAQQKEADSNAALGMKPAQAPSPFKAPPTATTKPAAGTPRTGNTTASSQAGVSKSSAKQQPAKSNGVAAKTTEISVAHVNPAPKQAASKPAAEKIVASAPKKAEAVAVEDMKNPLEPKKAPANTFSMNGKRDPFMSPVVTSTLTGSGCSAGKKCLSIEQIALKGVVKGDNGMIAVVVNALDKAYFLRENDPVFNGYVVKITGDSIVFKQMLQDRLGKSFSREVTKKINTPAV